ncbi:MAG: TatD family hydrolase [Dictyoglomaceae bacterium]|nr:TatD family hydrolase [Dictyoglomaceae bacterium]
MWIDLHTHLNHDLLYKNWKEIYERSKRVRVEVLITVGFDFESSEIAIELSSLEKGIFASIGIHPHDSDSLNYDDFPWENLITPKTIAIGEIGLDYYRMYSSKEKQIKIFREGINFAKKYNLPIIIHCRDAYQDLIKILKEEKAWELKGIMHSFSGSYEIAKVIANWDFLFSFSGPITYPNASRLREVVSKIPLDLIVIETDSPYLPPQSYRGRVNEPSYLIDIAKKLAEIKNISLEELEERIQENIKKIFPKIFKE